MSGWCSLSHQPKSAWLMCERAYELSLCSTDGPFEHFFFTYKGFEIKAIELFWWYCIFFLLVSIHLLDFRTHRKSWENPCVWPGVKLTVLWALAVTLLFPNFLFLRCPAVLVVRSVWVDAHQHFGLSTPLPLYSLTSCPVLLQVWWIDSGREFSFGILLTR